MTTNVATALLLAIAVGSGSFMVSLTKIFVPVRVAVASRISKSRKGRFFSWLSELLACPYCLGTWLSLAATAIYRPLIVHELWPLDYLVTVMFMNGTAMLTVLVIKKALAKAG